MKIVECKPQPFYKSLVERAEVRVPEELTESEYGGWIKKPETRRFEGETYEVYNLIFKFHSRFYAIASVWVKKQEDDKLEITYTSLFSPLSRWYNLPRILLGSIDDVIFFATLQLSREVANVIVINQQKTMPQKTDKEDLEFCSDIGRCINRFLSKKSVERSKRT